MAYKSVVDVQFPVGGMNRALAYQSQPPYTTPYCKNVRARDTAEGRFRGGSRPGLVKAVGTRFGTGPIHLLDQVRYTVNAQSTWEDTFGSDPMKADWSVVWWHPDGLPTLGSGNVYADHAVLDNCGAVRTALGINTADTYTIYETILPYGGYCRGDFIIYARMDDTTPAYYTDGVTVDYYGSAYGVTSYLYLNGWAGGVHHYAESTSFSAYATTNPLVLKLSVTVSTHVYVATLLDGPTTVATITKDMSGLLSGLTGNRFGFGLAAAGVGDRAIMDSFRIDYTASGTSAIGTNRSALCVVSGTAAATTDVAFKWESANNTFTSPSAIDPANANARHLQAVERLGKLYIVGEDSEKDSHTPADSYNWWPWVFDPDVAGGTPSLEELNYGDANCPTKCSCISRYRDRLVLSGKRDDPHNWWMSEQGDPTNWTYVSPTVGGPISGTNAEAGKIGDPVTAIVAHSDDFLLFGCLNSLWVLRGDPTYGGQIDKLSANLGIISPQAWCKGPNTETVFLSRDGLYSLAPGGASYPESLSREALPRELQDINVIPNRVMLGYDSRNRGVFIAVTDMTGLGGSYWWFDWEGKGFWPIDVPSDHRPTAMCYRASDTPSEQQLLFGCWDGYLRYFSDTGISDDGTNFSSEILYGPIMLGGSGYQDGILSEVIVTLGATSGSVSLGVKVGLNAEEAYSATEKYTATVSAGHNITHRPNLRGQAAFVRLYSSGGSAWTVENLTLVRRPLGKQRKT